MTYKYKGKVLKKGDRFISRGKYKTGRVLEYSGNEENFKVIEHGLGDDTRNSVYCRRSFLEQIYIPFKRVKATKLARRMYPDVIEVNGYLEIL